MAIISIPSSIAGISIPGLSSKGPLGALFDNPFRQDILQYPRDLNSATKGHVVQFGILETIPLTYEEVKSTAISLANDVQDAAKQALSNATSTASLDKIKNTLGSVFKGDFTDVSNAAASFGTAAGDVLNYLDSSKLNFQPRRTKAISYISLYMPDTLNFQIAAGYNEISVTDALKNVGTSAVGSLISAKKAGATSSFATSTIASGIQNFKGLALGKAGLAVNPQMQVLFQGIGFREYQMAFTFTPYSKQEAETVEKIVKMFRMHASPRIQTGLAGMFFVAPSAFTVKFLFNGKENTHLNKIKESVITSIDVNYSPNGWAAHDDGTPVQTTMTVQFKEIELVDRNAVNQGY